MKAVIYARFSSDNQREESITAQIRAAKEFCKKNGYQVIKEYTDEAFSARTDDSPAFQQMILDAQDRLFEILVVHKIDRFARNRYDSAFYKHQLKKAGVKLVCVDHCLHDTTKKNILESVLQGMAEYYSINLSREVKKGMKETALQAKHNGGTPPLGYDVAHDKTYIINEKEAPLVKKIFADYSEGKSLMAICHELNSIGYRTKRGSAFGKNSLHDLLKNPKYIGTYTFGRSSTNLDGKRNSRKASEDLISLKNALPALIDLKIWGKVQEKFKTNPTGNRAREVYLCSGVLRCPCGSTLVGNRYKGRTKDYAYYRCNESTRTGQCESPKYQKEPLEKTLIEKILPAILSDENSKLFIKIVNEKMTLFAQENLDHIQTLEKEKKSAKSKIERLLDIIENGNGTTAIVERIKENENIISYIDQQLKKIQAKMRKVTLTESQLKEVFRALKNEKEPAALKLLVQTFVESILIDPEKDDLKIVFKIDTKRYEVTAKDLGWSWWRRGESNPCPEAQSQRFLRAQSTI